MTIPRSFWAVRSRYRRIEAQEKIGKPRHVFASRRRACEFGDGIRDSAKPVTSIEGMFERGERSSFVAYVVLRVIPGDDPERLLP
jgi:hypothetical protein